MFSNVIQGLSRKRYLAQALSAISWNSPALSKLLNLVSGNSIAGSTQSIYSLISFIFFKSEEIFLDYLYAISASATPMV